MAVRRVDPLPYQVKIVDPDTGLPTQFFMRVWDAAFNGVNTVGDVLGVEIIAGVGLSGGGLIGDFAPITLDLEDTAVTPGTYGDATNIPQVTVDQQGRITNIEDIPVDIPSGTIAIEEDDVAVADADTINFEGDVTVTDDGDGKVTITFTGGGGGGGSTDHFDKFTDIPAMPGWDPLQGNSGQFTFSNNNKRVTATSGVTWNGIAGTPARYKGKYYFEGVAGSSSFAAFGVVGPGGRARRMEGTLLGSQTMGQIGWEAGGTVRSESNNNQQTAIGTAESWSATNTLCVAVDLDAWLIWFRKDSGNWNNDGSADPATGVGGFDLSWAFSGASAPLLWPAATMTATTFDLFLLSADFTQTPPSGFLPWGGS